MLTQAARTRKRPELPREMEVARKAVYHTKAIESPVWGTPNEGTKEELEDINRLLCRYFEHTYGSNETSEESESTLRIGVQGRLEARGAAARLTLRRSRTPDARGLRARCLPRRGLCRASGTT